MDFKNVALNNDSDSEDEFVNIVVPLFEQADSEITKSAVKEMLSRSTDLKQKAEKKIKGKKGSFCVLYGRWGDLIVCSSLDQVVRILALAQGGV